MCEDPGAVGSDEVAEAPTHPKAHGLRGKICRGLDEAYSGKNKDRLDRGQS